MCALAAPAVPHPLPSDAAGVAGLFPSVSSRLLPRPAAFSLVPQVHRPAELWNWRGRRVLRKNYIAALLHSAPR